jgi:predicted RND superfamily exporter protein
MYVDASDMKCNVIIYCRDKTAETIKIVTDRINEYIRGHSLFGKRSKDVERHGFDKFVYWLETVFRGAPPPVPEKPPIPGVPQVHYRTAGGTVGVQAAINEALVMYGFWTFILAMLTVFVFCAVAFRSVVAGILNCLPLVLANSLAYAFMALNDPPIPMTTATLPVAAVSIGLGVDYGIYFFSRVIEEYRKNNNLNESVIIAMGTTGKAIIYIATTIVCGIAFWFLSKLMFQALMGMLLGIVLLLNMVFSLTIIPSFIVLFKPKFITRQQ